MKKLLVFLAVLFVSVMSSACINNLAIQELNTKAKEYLDKGDYDEAAKRLESSVDLDGTVFETRYNLAVAYIHKEEFAKAEAQLREALKLSPDSADAYYTLGVALEGEAHSKLDKEFQVKGKNSDSLTPHIEYSHAAKKIHNPKDGIYSVSKLKDAVKVYNLYLKYADNPSDGNDVVAHINELKKDIKYYSAEYGFD